MIVKINNKFQKSVIKNHQNIFNNFLKKNNKEEQKNRKKKKKEKKSNVY